MKKILLIVLAVILMIGLIGCVSLNEIQTNSKEVKINVKEKYYDSIKNPFTTYTVKIGMKAWTSIETYSITKYVFNNSTDMFYHFEIDFWGESWRFMNGDITFQADQEIFTIIDHNHYRKVLSGGDIREIIRAEISREQLIILSEASSVRFQYYGEPKSLTEGQIQKIKLFLIEY